MLQFQRCAAYSAFQQVRRSALHDALLIGIAAIFGYKKNDGLRESARVSYPCGEKSDGREELTSQLHTCMEGKVVAEI